MPLVNRACTATLSCHRTVRGWPWTPSIRRAAPRTSGWWSWRAASPRASRSIRGTTSIRSGRRTAAGLCSVPIAMAASTTCIRSGQTAWGSRNPSSRRARTCCRTVFRPTGASSSTAPPSMAAPRLGSCPSWGSRRCACSIRRGLFRPAAKCRRMADGWRTTPTNRDDSRSTCRASRRRVAASGRSRKTAAGIPRWRRDGRELFYYASDGRLMAVPVRSATRLDVGAAVPLFEAHLLNGPAWTGLPAPVRRGARRPAVPAQRAARRRGRLIDHRRPELGGRSQEVGEILGQLGAGAWARLPTQLGSPCLGPAGGPEQRRRGFPLATRQLDSHMPTSDADWLTGNTRAD